MIANLPAHPLIVHFTVALLVLVPLGVLTSVVWPAMRNRLDWLLPLGAVVAGALALIAGQTGEALEHSLPVRLPAVEAHGGWGEWAQRVGGLFAITVVLWWASVTESPVKVADRPFLRTAAARRVLSVVVALVSVATLVVVTLTGHSGAVAVWGG